MVDREDVRTAYRVLLGREPENEEVVAQHAGHFQTVADLHQAFFHSLEYRVRSGEQIDPVAIPDENLYAPLFSPWLGSGEFASFHGRAADHTIVSPDRCYVLYTLAKQALTLQGDFWECGVYRGGTAALLAEIIARKSSDSNRRLHLFDTFVGMPETDPERDHHRRGDFSDTTLASVKAIVGNENITVYHEGLIPETFNDLGHARIVLAHIDVDIYQSVLDCCKFIYPRLVRGGFMIFDDYGFPSCPGARSAVDEYFCWTTSYPLVLPTGQALVFKSD